MEIIPKLPNELTRMVFEFLPGEIQGQLQRDAYFKYPIGYSKEFIHYCIINDLWMPFHKILLQHISILNEDMFTFENGVIRSQLSIIKMNMMSSRPYSKCYTLLNIHITLFNVTQRLTKLVEKINNYTNTPTHTDNETILHNEHLIMAEELKKIIFIIKYNIKTTLNKYGKRKKTCDVWLPFFTK